MRSHRLSSIAMVVSWVLLGQVGAVFAQSAPSADLPGAWLDDALQARKSKDTFNRVAGAPAALILGAGLMALPPLAADDIDMSPATSALTMVSGGLLATAAIGSWALENPDDSQTWVTNFGSLGFVGVGGVLMLQGISAEHEDAASKPIGPRLQVAFGAADIGVFLTLFVLQQVLPPESPAQLELSLRDRGLEQRRAAVREFLVRREHQRRVSTYLTLPWLLPLGLAPLYVAHDAATSGGRAFLYTVGVVYSAIALGTLLYELLRTPDWKRFDAGEFPDD